MRVETYTNPYNDKKITAGKIEAVYAVKSDNKKSDNGAVTDGDKKKNCDTYESTVKIDLDKSCEALKDEKAKLKIMTTCMKISKRLLSGDNVPVADKNYLRKNDPSLYARSIIKRFPKPNPYKYRRISPYEKEEIDTTASVSEGMKEFTTAATADIPVAEIPSTDTKTTE